MATSLSAIEQSTLVNQIGPEPGPKPPTDEATIKPKN